MGNRRGTEIIHTEIIHTEIITRILYLMIIFHKMIQRKFYFTYYDIMTYVASLILSLHFLTSG